VEISYRKVAATFTPASVSGATGVTVTAVLVIPDCVVTYDLDDATTPAQITSLDIYMLDFEYVRVF
jgi:hypothetical protein